MALPYHVWYRLARRKMSLAAEVEATRPGRRAWVGVSPVCGDRYRVQYFELQESDVEMVKNTYDYDYYWLNVRHFETGDLCELERLLSQWLDDLERLVDPHFCDYPI